MGSDLVSNQLRVRQRFSQQQLEYRIPRQTLFTQGIWPNLTQFGTLFTKGLQNPLREP